MHSHYRRNQAANSRTDEAIKMQDNNQENLNTETTDNAAEPKASRFAKWKAPAKRAAKIGGGILALGVVGVGGYMLIKGLRSSGNGVAEAAGDALEGVVGPVVESAAEAVAGFRK